ncbi:hypothetical protein [Frateuria defendens]|uniref:hypothetical protein n=1 Tax=Frateuria defendens TaxID=2219559 RepID=UPI000A547809|nr:hypothetical protein [Frateuria defendens]
MTTSNTPRCHHLAPSAWLGIAIAFTILIYWPGIYGSWLFDDYPNIVDNKGVQPSDSSLPSLVQATLSSPASEFKRPLASLSFAANYLFTGLDPFWMKLTNLAIHLLNGVMLFLLTRMLMRSLIAPTGDRTATWPAALVTGAWMVLPINLTSVLYVVQRMESLANLFVLAGLLGYVTARQRMLAGRSGFALTVISLIVPTMLGVLSKETAVMLPLYALIVEWVLFRFASAKTADGALPVTSDDSALAATDRHSRKDPRIVLLYVLLLALPLTVGLGWLLPLVLKPESWATRDFTLQTRLLSEARIVVDYILWTVLPTPHALSFYHDDFSISSGLLTPISTLISLLLIAGFLALAIVLRYRQPLASLGMLWFLGAQLLTGTILPLELVYEHRNYFASYGLLLALLPSLAGRQEVKRHDWLLLARYTILGGLALLWICVTALTAQAWGDPLRLAEELAARAPDSPRAQYELGRTYIIYSHYDPTSPFTQRAYAPLERAAALPQSSILPQQALIFMNSRMRLPLKDEWWSSMIEKLKTKRPGVQDESSLAALTQCAREDHCDLPKSRMVASFTAALAHPAPSARLLATYGDYAWNVLDNHELGIRMTREAVQASPYEPAYQITLIRMLAAQQRYGEARTAITRLQALNVGGRLDSSIANLRDQLPQP